MARLVPVSRQPRGASMIRGASPPRTPLRAHSRGPRRPTPFARGAPDGAPRSCLPSAPGGFYQSGGLRPRGPPYALTRGDPVAPLRSRGARQMARLVPVSRQPRGASIFIRGASPPRTPLRAHSRGPRRPTPFARGAPDGAPRSCLPSAPGGFYFYSGGLRPRGPPYALTRGDPVAPLRSRGARQMARLVPVSRQPRGASIYPGGFAPADPPTRSLAGTPSPRSVRAGRARWRASFLSPVSPGGLLLIRGASPPRTPLRAHSRGPRRPAPFARGAPDGAPRSCLPSAPGGFYFDPGGFAPADPPTRSLAGPPSPRSVRAGRARWRATHPYWRRRSTVPV